MTKTVVPAKIILTGEHAVVYGKPAIVMAIDQYTQATVTPGAAATIAATIHAGGETVIRSYPLSTLNAECAAIDRRYEEFRAGRATIAEILREPFDMIPYAFNVPLQPGNVTVREGIALDITSSAPMGCGLGSSAAIALSVIAGAARQYDIELSREEMFHMALRCERLCHGTPSGADPYTCLHGGVIRFQDGQAERVSVAKFPFCLALTGKPVSSTGECVTAVRQKFAAHAIWDEFGRTTEALRRAFMSGDMAAIIAGVRQNHRLLMEIGVVPGKVAACIAELEDRGGAGKITGAGSIRGKTAGAVLIFGAFDPADICRRYGYELLTVGVDRHGLRYL